MTDEKIPGIIRDFVQAVEAQTVTGYSFAAIIEDRSSTLIRFPFTGTCSMHISSFLAADDTFHRFV
jgi:hypothetical protein